MRLDEIKDRLPQKVYQILAKDITELRPAQCKAVEAGLLDGKSLLVCTPTASGKTLVAEMGMLKGIIERKGKAVYVVPLRALAHEKFRDFQKKYGEIIRVAISSGDIDSADTFLRDYDLIITTSEKLDSLTRHNAPWLKFIKVIVVDEVHLLNDTQRGPTLEILITMLREMLPSTQFICLSATIGNPQELAEWLGAVLVLDSWRPVKLYEGVYREGEIRF